MQALINRLGRRRFAVLALADMAIWWAALATAMFARVNFDVAAARWPEVARVALAASALQLVCGLASRLYLGARRLASFEEVRLTAGCVAAVTVLLYAGDQLLSPTPLPRSVILAGGAYTLIGSFGFRYGVRALIDATGISRHPRRRRVIVYGAGDAGFEVVRAILADQTSDLRPVAYLDDDPAKSRLRIHGLPIRGGRAAIGRVAAEMEAQTLLIAMPSAPQRTVIEVADEAQAAGLDVLIVPHLAKFLTEQPVEAVDIRDITLADFLERDEVEMDLQSVSHYLTGKRVLVTGAGGSIGSELCETVMRFRPDRLIMLDHDENALHRLQLSIFGRVVESTDVVLADIRDADTLRDVFADRAPHVVFHAAAHKHVPFLERHPGEAVKTNVAGTLNVLNAAVEAGVEHFVNISSDKAADAASVLGASKRVAELLTAEIGSSVAGQYMSVRFGNVLGSNGSVIPLLQSQLASGQPMTITHPEVTRYFMTIEEAVQLVVQAGALGDNGEVMVLDMGKPVRIVDLARRLAAIMTPGRAPEIEYIGLRDGEKLHEVLVDSRDTLLDRPHPLVTRYRTSRLNWDDVSDLVALRDGDLIRKRLLELTS